MILSKIEKAIINVKADEHYETQGSNEYNVFIEGVLWAVNRYKTQSPSVRRKDLSKVLRDMRLMKQISEFLPEEHTGPGSEDDSWFSQFNYTTTTNNSKE